MLFKSFAVLLHSFILPKWHPTWQSKLAIMCCISVVFAFAFAAIFHCKFFERLLSMFSRKVLHDEMLLSLIDYTEGTQISAVLKDGSVYTGDIYQIEEKGDASWISVDNYRLIMSDGSIIEDEDLGAPTLMMFKLSDVERIHLGYPEKSRFAKEIKERKTEHN